LDNWIGLLPEVLGNGWVTAAEVDHLRALEGQLAGTSGQANAHLWRGDALTNSAQWALIREQARDFLFAGG
jgi:hypothetical protein